MLQKDLNAEFGALGIQIPELKVEIPKLDVQLPDDIQPDHLKDILGPSISSQIQGASTEQIKALATLQLALNNITDQYNKARESILNRSTAIQESNGVIDANTKAIADNGSRILDNVNATKSAANTTRMSMEIVGATGEKVSGLTGNISNLNDTLGTATKGQGEYSKSIEDVIKNTSDGAVIFGFTKEELLGLRDATDEATKSTENLGENGLTVATEKAGQAGKTLETLDANLMNVADRNKDVADLQDQVNQTR